VSRRVELEQRLGRLGDITGIMNAMKTMALIETRKYGHCITPQRRHLDGILAAAADFLEFHPEFRSPDRNAAPGDGPRLLVALGSERGFCGDFNQKLAAALPMQDGPETRWIAVGRRLAGRLESDPRLLDRLEGPNVAEEVPVILDRLIETLHRHADGPHRWRRLSVVAHDAGGEIVREDLLPLAVQPARRRGYPPRLHYPPGRMFAELIEHYLSAKLPGLLHASLMAENRRRLEHMETALNRLRTKMDEITRRCNALRQEEITEQIEVILLGMK
jgi:F-type H+-transporting ATPase subunit gamma